jgi:hypothetical protein
MRCLTKSGCSLTSTCLLILSAACEFGAVACGSSSNSSGTDRGIGGSTTMTAATGGSSSTLGGTAANANGGAASNNTGGYANGTGGNANVSTGGSVSNGTGGSMAKSTGGSVNNGTGGSTAKSTGGSVSSGTGGSTAKSTGGSVSNGTGGSTAKSTGGSVSSGTGGSTAKSTGGTVSVSSGGTSSATGGTANSATGGKTGGTTSTLGHFSFFITSLEAMLRLSGSANGFGGDLRYKQTTGLAGADKICSDIGEASMAGAASKQWRAFLSTKTGPINAIDRVGAGPWYDRLGRVVALTKADLALDRPRNADPIIINDLPNEFGVPNHRPNPAVAAVDNHHVMTGSTTQGLLYTGTTNPTCDDWTSVVPTAGRPRVGFSWIASGRTNWISGQDEGGCAAGVNTVETGGSTTSNPIVGSGGGYGGIYCFALTP